MAEPVRLTRKLGLLSCILITFAQQISDTLITPLSTRTCQLKKVFNEVLLKKAVLELRPQWVNRGILSWYSPKLPGSGDVWLLGNTSREPRHWIAEFIRGQTSHTQRWLPGYSLDSMLAVWLIVETSVWWKRRLPIFCAYIYRWLSARLQYL